MNITRIKPYLIIKRLIDFSFSLIGLIILSPIILIVTILIWCNLGYPVLFKQERPGLNGQLFKIIKFRTMRDAFDAQGNLLPDEKRINTFGRFLRKTSLDELPEFFNVLVGDMSLVGPRPLLVKYLPYFNERELKRLQVKPGITGLAQVNGRHLLSWDERLELDAKYVEELSFCLDIKILSKTVLNVIRQKDVLSVSSEFIPDFDIYRKNQLKNKSVGD